MLFYEETRLWVKDNKWVRHSSSRLSNAKTDGSLTFNYADF